MLVVMLVLLIATTDDLTEGSTNLYYTDARADARVAAATGANLDLSGKSTTDLSEGTNRLHRSKSSGKTG